LPLSEEEEEYLARRRVGEEVWTSLSYDEQTQLMKMRVREGQTFDEFLVGSGC